MCVHFSLSTYAEICGVGGGIPRNRLILITTPALSRGILQQYLILSHHSGYTLFTINCSFYLICIYLINNENLTLGISFSLNCPLICFAPFSVVFLHLFGVCVCVFVITPCIFHISSSQLNLKYPYVLWRQGPP